jgi:hypothetical protein
MRRLGLAVAVIGAGLALGVADAGAATHYVPTYVPGGYHYAGVRYDGLHYGHGLVVATSTGPPCCGDYTKGRPFRIRGHAGRLGKLVLYDYERYVYGRYLAWEERPGHWILVEDQTQTGRVLSVRKLRRVARSLEPVSDEYWRRLEIGSQDDPYKSELPAGRKKRFVKRGRANGHRWELRALVPRDFPLGWYDLRTPCTILAYRGKSTYGFDCIESTTWMLIRGQIFVFGVIPKRIRHVRIEPLGGYKGSTRTFTTIRRPWLGRYGYYVAAMPRDTCHVEVVDADTGRDVGPTGPIFNNTENKRCNS